MVSVRNKKNYYQILPLISRALGYVTHRIKQEFTEDDCLQIIVNK